jgi:hypothetical protein
MGNALEWLAVRYGVWVLIGVTGDAYLQAAFDTLSESGSQALFKHLIQTTPGGCHIQHGNVLFLTHLKSTRLILGHLPAIGGVTVLMTSTCCTGGVTRDG